MRQRAIGTFGAAALAAVLVAQAAGQVGNQFRLDLGLIARSGDPATGIQDFSGPVNIMPGQRVRVEMRYRVVDLVSNNVASRGLSAAEIAISNDRGSAAGTVERSTLTDSQLAPGAFAPLGNGALNPDFSGQTDLANTGMMEPFRAGLQTNTSLANGAYYFGQSQLRGPAGLRLDGQGFSILPLVLAAPAHQSWSGPSTANIAPADTDTNPSSWAIYSFDYIASASFSGPITFSASVLPGQTGQAFQFFTRTGTVNNTVPVIGNNFTNASLTINVIPGPGAGAAISLSALMLATRRRR